MQFDRGESKWHVGVRSFTVGASFARRRNFSAQAIPYLRKLRDLTRETANLALVDDEFIIVLTRMESREIMRSLTKFVGRVPMVTSASARRCSQPIRTRTSAPSSAINPLVEPRAATSVSGMTSRVTDERLPEIGQNVRDVAAELTAALGGVIPAPPLTKNPEACHWTASAVLVDMRPNDTMRQTSA